MQLVEIIQYFIQVAILLKEELPLTKNKLVNSVTKEQCDTDYLMYVKASAKPVDVFILEV